MAGHYITPPESVLKRTIDNILSAQVREDPEDSGNILWIDLTQGEKISKAWEKTQQIFCTTGINAACALVPEPPNEGLNWAFIYQILCHLVTFQKKNKIVLYYLIIPSEGLTQNKNSQKQIFAFVKHALENTLHSNGVYRFSASFFDNSPGNMEVSFYKNIALDSLHQVKEQFSMETNDFLSEKFPLANGDFNRTFDESLRHTATRFSNSLPAVAAITSRKNFTATFGFLKDQSIETFIQNLSFSENEAVSSNQALFSRPDTPLADIYEELDSFYLFMPNCFSHPVEHNFLSELPSPRQDLPGQLFCMAILGSEGTLLAQEGNSLHRIMELFQSIGVQIGHLRSNPNSQRNLQNIPRINRKQVKRQLRQEFEELLQLITDLVDNEHHLLRTDEDLILRNSDIFINAYTNFHRFFFHSFLFSITMTLWSTRKVIFFLPTWFPSPIFKRTGIFPIICDMMIQGLRLLNLYRYIHFSLVNCREQFKAIGSKIIEIQQRSNSIDKQFTNIEKELNLTPHHQETIYREAELNDLYFTDTPLPERETLIEENLHKEETVMTVKQWASNAFSLIEGSINDGTPYNEGTSEIYWMPGYYNYHEAWLISKQMIGALKKSRLFQFDGVVTSLPQGMCAYKYCDHINDLNDENEWFKWKKHGLQTSDDPFVNDVLTPSAMYIHLKDLSMDQLIEWGMNHQFLIKDTQDRLALCNAAYPFLQPEDRPFFFQRNEPLSQRLFDERLHSHAYHKIIAYLKWIITKDSFKDSFQKSQLQSLRADMNHLIVLKTTSYESIGMLFDIFDRISNQKQKLEHPYFGKFINAPSLFFLENTFDPVLMNFMKPENRQHCQSRFFSKSYLKASLESKDDLLHAIIKTFDSMYILNHDFNELNDQKKK